MTTIWVTWQQEGWHSWPDAPESRKYLRASHRHMFHFRVEMEVWEADREVELHDLLAVCKKGLNMSFGRSAYSTSGLDFTHSSCEMLAQLMCVVLRDNGSTPGQLNTEWRSRWLACEVSEDGECGARVEVGR